MILATDQVPLGDIASGLRVMACRAAELVGRVAPTPAEVWMRRSVGKGVHYTSNIAFVVSAASKESPRQVAELIANRLETEPGVAVAEAARSGLIRIAMSDEILSALIPHILSADGDYGRNSVLRGQILARSIPSGDLLDASLTEARRRIVDEAVATLWVASGGEVTRDVAPPTSAAAPVVVVHSGQQKTRNGRLNSSPDTMDALTGLVGVEAARFAFLRSPMDSPLQIDSAIWGRRIPENPLFIVQFAYSRLCASLRYATALGMAPPHPSTVDMMLLEEPIERELIGMLADYPQWISRAARQRAPHRFVRFCEEMADIGLRFIETCPALPRGDEPLSVKSQTRLLLCGAARQVLANALSLVRITAPERL